MQASLKPWQSIALSVLVALMPLSFSIGHRIKALPVALLFLAGLALVACSRQTRASYRAAWPAVLAALLMMGFVIVNVLVHQLGWRPLDWPGHILLFLVVAAVFAQPLRMRLVWGGFSVSLIVLGVTCIVQHHVLGIERAYGLSGGKSASIELATVLLGLSLAALARLLDSRNNLPEKILHLAALALGMYGALLTQSRGPLLAFAPMFVLLVLLHARQTGRWRSSLLLVGAVCAVATAATFSMRGQVMERFEAIAPEIASTDQPGEHGAVRERLEMWRTAGRAFLEHPVAGIGTHQFNRYARDEIAAGNSDPVIARYNQPHNQYLEAAATGGIPGLLVLLLVFALPLLYFMRHAKHADEAVRLPAHVGLALTCLYMLCALTDSVFYRVMPQSFYFFTVLGLAVRIGWMTARPLSRRNPQQETPAHAAAKIGKAEAGPWVSRPGFSGQPAAAIAGRRRRSAGGRGD